MLEVPADVWKGVLDVYHSYDMPVAHLPQLLADMQNPVVLRSKPRVLREIRGKLDPSAYRVANYSSADDLKQADIHLVMDRLHDMVGRRVISREPADALMRSASQCFQLTSREIGWKMWDGAVRYSVHASVVSGGISLLSGIGLYIGNRNNEKILVDSMSVGKLVFISTVVISVVCLLLQVIDEFAVKNSQILHQWTER